MITGGRVRPQRTCDRCGALRPGEAFRVISGRWVCNWHDHYVAPETLEKLPLKTFPIKPFKDAKPLEPRETYEAAEWEILNYLANSGWVTGHLISDFAAPVPASNAFDSFGVEGAGYACVYLYALITENKRPRAMLSFARTLIRSAADFLLSRQYAAPHLANGATNIEPGWGAFSNNILSAFPNNVNVRTSHVAAGGLGLLRAYQILGDQKYLDASRAAIWFCRTAQCASKCNFSFPTSDSGGTSVLTVPSWSRMCVVASGGITYDSYFTLEELIIFEFYNVFMTVIGNEIIGSPSTAGAFPTGRASTISAAIAEALTFWTTGIFGVNQNAVVNGLSATTPYEGFNAYGHNKSFLAGTGSWRYSDNEQLTGTYVRGDCYGRALRGLRSVLGDVAPVTTIFDWLMTFTSNPAHALPAKYNDQILYAPLYTNGTFDPTFALAYEMQVRSAGQNVTMSGSSSIKSYSIGNTGLLAGLYSSRQRTGFKSYKLALSEPRHHTVGRGEDGRYHYLAKCGLVGYSLQPTQAAGRAYSVLYAAQCGLAYRELPQAFMGTGV